MFVRKSTCSVCGVWRETPQDGDFASIDLVNIIVSKSYEKQMCGVMLSVCVEAACIT